MTTRHFNLPYDKTRPTLWRIYAASAHRNEPRLNRAANAYTRDAGINAVTTLQLGHRELEAGLDGVVTSLASSPLTVRVPPSSRQHWAHSEKALVHVCKRHDVA